MFRLLEESPQRIAVIISADLAHTHKADGPYGYSNASQPFDDVCCLFSIPNELFVLVTSHSVIRMVGYIIFFFKKNLKFKLFYINNTYKR